MIDSWVEFCTHELEVGARWEMLGDRGCQDDPKRALGILAA